MMGRSAILVAFVASFAAAAAAGPGASAGYCYCPYGPYSRAFHNCADDCIRHADAVYGRRILGDPPLHLTPARGAAQWP